MKIFIVITASVSVMISMFLYACKKEILPSVSCSDKTNSIELVRQLLPGSYSWAYSVVTYYGNNSFIETPSTTGVRYKYTFNQNGTVYYYENDTLKSTDSYLIDYEFRVTTYSSDSATIIIINDKQSGQRKEFFRPYLCNDSALFYNPYNSVDYKRYLKRN
jgi:hypothetical protein